MRYFSTNVKCNDIKTLCKKTILQKSRWPKLPRWLLVVAFAFLASSGLAVAEEDAAVAEYQLKAAYLSKLANFTDWPTNSFASANAPLVIGIVGQDPFGNTLDELIKNEAVRDHPLVIKHVRASEDFQSCHVLFINLAKKEQLSALLQKLKGSPVLTVSDASGFADRGGMINFVLVKEKVTADDKEITQDKVKLEINQAAAEDAGLRISAKLLKLARVVKSTGTDLTKKP